MRASSTTAVRRPLPLPDAVPHAAARRNLRVLVADRHEATRAGLRAVLVGRGFDVCAQCPDAPDCVACTAVERPDVCVVDVGLPGGGLTAAAAISCRADAPRIVMLAATADPEHFFAALQAGADAYLLKEAGGDALEHAIRTVAGGDAYVGPPFLRRLVEDFRARRGRLPGELSPRQAEVLRLLREGLTTKQVAARLGVSPTTVRRHISSALQRLECDDRVAALRLLAVQPDTERP